MFQTLVTKIGGDRDLPERAARLSILARVLDGSVYDCLRHEFHEERNGAGEYIPIAQRRPSVRQNLCRTVVQDSISLLFGEGRFPTIRCKSQAVAEILTDVVAECRLNDVMVEAAYRGSVGSVAILMRVLRNRLFFSVMPTVYLTPEWDPEAPDTLLRVTERYKVRGDALKARGYPIDDGDMGAWFWFQRTWDGAAETWFVPWKVVDQEAAPQPDEARTVRHNLGFVPVVWIRNLPGGDDIDGCCTFAPAIETQIEIEYQLSQAGRGLKYSSDPTLLIKEPARADGQMVRSAANALIVSEKGDAKLLEIGGTASEAVIGYARHLREIALESIHGNRSNADKVSAAQSGRALEMLHQPLIWLADKLRTSYGGGGLLALLRMVVAARQKMALTLHGEAMPDLPPRERISLAWPAWFHPTEGDRATQAGTLRTLTDAGLLSHETGTTVIADGYGITDAQAERTKIAAEIAAEDARAIERAAQVKATETLPA